MTAMANIRQNTGKHLWQMAKLANSNGKQLWQNRRKKT
jgi:hypothetical protein